MNTFLKSEAKIHAVNELGCRLDDALDDSNKSLFREEGAAAAFRAAVVSMENLLKVLDKELDEKNVDLDSSKTIKEYVNRARSLMQSHAETAEHKRQAEVGKIQAFQQAVSIAKRYKDEEINRLQTLKNAIESNIENGEAISETSENEGKKTRAPGERPGSSIKMRRLAEEYVKSSSENTEESKDEVPQDQEETKTKSKKQKK